jgi:hypothetical protein
MSLEDDLFGPEAQKLLARSILKGIMPPIIIVLFSVAVISFFMGYEYGKEEVCRIENTKELK